MNPRTGSSGGEPAFPVGLANRGQFELVFGRERPEVGRQWTERRLLSGLKRVLAGPNLPGKPHTFRHSFISDALLKGTAVALVRKWVGHIDPHVIDLYTHIHDASSQAAMRRLGSTESATASKDDPDDAKDSESGTGPAQKGVWLWRE